MSFLVLQLARFGDIIQSKRLIKTLEQRGEVHICVDASLAALARLVYPSSVIHAMPAFHVNEKILWAEGLPVLQTLQDLRPDAVYNLNYSPLSRVITCLFEPETVHGYSMAHGQPLRDAWVGMAFRWMQNRRTSPFNLVDFWAHFTHNPLAPELVNQPASPRGETLGVVLAGQNARRSLEPAVLSPLIHALFNRLGHPPVLLFGSETEKKTARSLMDTLPPALYAHTTNLVGKTSFPELAQNLQNLRLLLSPDTGTAHLAAHLGVPVLGLFCSSASAFETGPYGLGHYALQVSRPCAPCVENRPCLYALPDADVPCKAPFKSGELLSLLSKQCPASSPFPPTPTIDGLIFSRSAFDATGLVWEIIGPTLSPSSEHAERAERAERRALLAACLGKHSPLLDEPARQTSLGKLASLLFEEKDHVFPPYYDKREWM